MPAIVPVNEPAPGYPALAPLAVRSSAVSREAKHVRVAAEALINAGERSQALFAERSAAISRLWALATECQEENWDGSGAAPIDLDAVVLAERFLRALPDRAPLPEVAVDPDGAISLDWIHSRNHLFSVSIGRTGRLACAWLDGTDKGHCVARFDGRTVPPIILEGIEAVARTENAFIRAS